MAYIGKKPADRFRGVAFKDTFTGDGSTTVFDMTFAATEGADHDIEVFVNNVRQEAGASDSYTLGLDGNGDVKRITFNVAPAAADEIYVINPGTISSLLQPQDNSITTAKIAADAVTEAKIADSAVENEHINANVITGQTAVTSLQDSDVFLVYDDSASALRKVEKQYVATSTLSYTNGTFTGDGSTTTITIDSGRAVNDVLVHVNGFLLVPTDDYTISGTTLTFTTAPASSAEISVRYLPLTGAATYTNDTATGDGSTTGFTIDSGRTVEDVMVSVNGVTLVPSTDYSISGTTLTFTTAPASSAEISIRYLRLT
jgi:hypothetical protein